MADGTWTVTLRCDATLPAMAWLLAARPPRADVVHGPLVRPLAGGIWEGTWVGSATAGPLASTTPFGSGVFVDGSAVIVVPPGHMLEGVYVRSSPGELLASNSLAGLLALAGAELDPHAPYPPLFNESVDGVMRTSIPASNGPLTAWFMDNLRLELDGTVRAESKPTERPFESFDDYRDRLSAAARSALANAPPRWQPAVTVSSGYDGAAVAALAREHGCRRVVTLREGKPVRGSDELADSGERVARALAMDVETFPRLAYMERDDLPEAEFLATGFSGEEVVLSGMEPQLRRSVLLTGFFGDGMWWMNRPRRKPLWRSDQSGSSLGEWRLRVGFAHVPLPCFGARHHRSTQRISRSAEMRSWVLGRRYDKPIPRRILEDAGVPRGAFGEVKRAASASIHTDGPRAMAPASVVALEQFAARDGGHLAFRPRRPPGRARRAAMKLARSAGIESVAARLERTKHALAMHEPHFGSLLLRWAVSIVRPRYERAAAQLRAAQR